MKVITTESVLNTLMNTISSKLLNVFNIVYNEYKNDVMQVIKFPNKPPIEMLLKHDIIIFFKYLCGQDFPEIADNHEITEMDVEAGVNRAIKYISNFKRKFIKFPQTIVDSMQMTRSFKSICNLNNIIGLIGITSFPISDSAEELTLQICIDSKNCITALDTQVTKSETEIYDMIWRPLQRMNVSFTKQYKIYATTELYSQLIDMVQPCLPEQRILNSKVEQVFDNLRKNIDRLNKLQYNNLDNESMVVTTCVIHNILMMNK